MVRVIGCEQAGSNFGGNHAGTLVKLNQVSLYGFGRFAQTEAQKLNLGNGQRRVGGLLHQFTSALLLATALECGEQLAPVLDLLGLCLKRPLKVGNCLFWLAALQQHGTQTTVRYGLVWKQLEDGAVALFRWFHTTGAKVDFGLLQRMRQC